MSVSTNKDLLPSIKARPKIFCAPQYVYLLTCKRGTLEVPQPLSGVTASVCQEVRPVTRVEVRVISQPQHHGNVGVLCLTRHLGPQ